MDENWCGQALSDLSPNVWSVCWPIDLTLGGWLGWAYEVAVIDEGRGCLPLRMLNSETTIHVEIGLDTRAVFDLQCTIHASY